MNNDKKKTMNYKIIEGREVVVNDILEALELDREYYSIPDDEQFDIQKCLNWYSKNDRIYTMIKDNTTGQIVGYINAAPINDRCYQDIKDGKFPDADINDDDVIDYLSPGEFKLYFASIVLDDKKDRIIRFKLLYEAFIDKLIKLTKENIIITRILADAISVKGKELCKASGLTRIKNTDHDDSMIFEIELFPPNFKVHTSKQKELFDVLMTKYMEVNNK